MSLAAILDTFSSEKAVVRQDGKYVEKDRDGISLKGVLQRGRLKLLRDRKPYRVGLTFRPSGITWSYCRRLKVAQLAGKVDIYDELKRPSEQTTLDLGNAIHDMLQGYFWNIGILKGSFECLKCDKIYHELQAPKACPSGIESHKRKHLRYKEVIMRYPEYLISGRCDGVLLIEDEDHLMDIKSIKNRLPKSNDREFCFEDLETKGPKEEHVVQLVLYMWMSEIRRGHLLYFAKNTSQIKTFDIPYNYSLIEPYLNEIEHLINLSEALKRGERVELPVPCGRESCPCHEF